jgi:hypothetical protein
MGLKHNVLHRQWMILLLLMAAGLLAVWSCEKIYHIEKRKFPATFSFSGTIRNGDQTALTHIRIVLQKPTEVDTSMVYTDTAGTFLMVEELEYAGPNKISVRDPSGVYKGIDTSFYITQDHWDTKKVNLNFVLNKH